jgi:hypothetical protein
VKVRDGLARNDYQDPGWYKHPPGTQAYEWKGDPPPAKRSSEPQRREPEFKARKPAAGSHNH